MMDSLVLCPINIPTNPHVWTPPMFRPHCPVLLMTVKNIKDNGKLALLLFSCQTVSAFHVSVGFSSPAAIVIFPEHLLY